jgi:hypothetical protein
MTEPKGTTELVWECDVCHAQVHVTRILRIGESAAEQAALNTDDLNAVRKRHQHEEKGGE